MHWRRLVVLVADDHGAYRTLLGWLLHKLGVGFELVADGQAALDALARRHFDLLITDCQMPVMDGLRLAREWRRREQSAGQGRLPIIAFSAALAPADVQRCLEAGMDAWLPKPLTLEVLRSALECWLPKACVPAPVFKPQPPDMELATRTRLVETFGCASVVEQMLHVLLHEVNEDRVALALARERQDAVMTTQRLHRLVGGIAFLGAVELELQGLQLIDAVRESGVLRNRYRLEKFQMEIDRYHAYLASI
jgi:CheY-like chemotaxis protein